jgi:predicted ATPase
MSGNSQDCLVLEKSEEDGVSQSARSHEEEEDAEGNETEITTAHTSSARHAVMGTARRSIRSVADTAREVDAADELWGVRERLLAAVYQDRNRVVAAQLKGEVTRRLLGWIESSGDDEEEDAVAFTERGRKPSWSSPSSLPLFPSLVTISGPPQTGKTYLARTTLRDAAAGSGRLLGGGYFVTGRWSEPDSPAASSAPFHAFASALHEFASLVVERGPAEISRVRLAVRRSVGVEVFVLTRFMPSLRDILESPGDGGDDDDNLPPRRDTIDADGGVNSVSPREAISAAEADLRFAYVFGRFFQAISSPQRPLVLHMDDLHNADVVSLNMLATILANSGNSPGFLVLATVQPSFTSKLRNVEAMNVLGRDITQFSLTNLGESELCHLLSHFLGVDSKDAQPLSLFLHRRTCGNPLFVTELLLYLIDRDLISQDLGSASWSWDVQDIDMTVDKSLSLEEALTHRILRLSDSCQETLKVASCLGTEFDTALIGYAVGRSAQSDLHEAVSRGLLSTENGRSDDPRYRFENTWIRRAAYSLVPQQNRLELHLDVGRRLWKRLDEASTDQYLFTVMAQFRIGQRLIQRPAEREAVASLCYHAGFRAARSSSFRVASEYFNLGIDLLGDKGWRESYDLALSLRNAASEMSMCSGDFELMDAHIKSILLNARLFRDSIQARATKIYSFGMSDARQSEAVREGIDVLRHLGVRIPSKSTRLRLTVELVGVRRILRNKTDNFFLRMPTLSNPEKRSCLQILSLVYQNALFATPDLVPFVILRMIKITIDHGMSEFASVAFANFGMLCIRRLGDVDMGYRYGSLGLAILDRFNANELVPRVYATFYKHIYVHKRPIKGTLQPLAKAYRIGLCTGDLEAAFLCALYFCMNSFDAGISLPVIAREYSDIIRRMEASRQKSMLTIALPLLRWKLDLMGLSNDPLKAEGDLVNYDTLARASQLSGRPLVVSVVLTCRLIVAHVLNEYKFAETLLSSFLDDYLDLIQEGSSKVGAIMTAGMCSIELARMGRNRNRNIRTAVVLTKRLRVSAKRSPCNCLDKYYLLEAELASFRKNSVKASQKYLASIALADASESRYVCAKANEALARHLYRRLNDDPEARVESHSYFAEACRVYKEWGASVKVERLVAEMRDLFPGQDDRTRPSARPSLLRASEGSSADMYATPRPRLSLLRATGDVFVPSEIGGRVG